ncbi:MAG: ferredoxin [Erysipelotrichaceae bacterium]|jgi:ferredoxin|nr:ferredoxin [Erysipelotrichaceae bacterium]MCB9499974.1 ferredoxin [Erysipelotrichaceae bacterium]
MSVKLKVDSDSCLGCGLCFGSYPTAFGEDSDGKAIVIGELDEATAEEAIANCPAGAITK